MTLMIESVTRSRDKRKFKGNKLLVLPDTLVGIEIEAERVAGIVSTMMQRSGFWDVTTDSSLRNGGKEFISLPVLGQDLINALSTANDIIGSNEQVSFGERTSVHIHLDCRELSVPEVVNILVTYTIFEKAFFRYIGKGRDKCIYCVPFYAAQTTVRGISDLIKAMSTNNSEAAGRAVSHWNKYQAVNLLSLINLGTIEFRHHYGTCSRVAILQWINLIMCLKAHAVAHPTLDRGAYISVNGIDAFAQLVFGDHLGAIAPYLNSGEIYEGMRLAQDFLITSSLEEGDVGVYNCNPEACITTQLSTKARRDKMLRTWSAAKLKQMTGPQAS